MNSTNRFRKLMRASGQYEAAIEQLWTCIQERRYSALLGPHYAGKSRILEHLLRRVKKERAFLGVKVNLSQVSMAANAQFLDRLADLIVEDLPAGYGPALERSGPKNMSGGEFRAFIESLLLRTRRSIVLVLDHLEALPRDILQNLLVSLRAQYMVQQSEPYQLIVLVSGALSLTAQATGETSPFYNIVTRIVLRELSWEESSRLLDIELSGYQAKISDKARALFLEHAQGDSYLIQELIQDCMRQVGSGPAPHLNTSTVRNVIEQFSARSNQDYPLFKEAVRLIEEDPDLLQSILILLERGTVSRLSLPLDASPDIGPLDLTSLVRKSASNEYTVRNEIYRRFLTGYFNPGRSGSLFMTHGRWDMALLYLEKSLQTGDRAYHSNFLETTLNAMYSAENVSHAASHFMNGLTAGFGVQQARLWMKVRDKEALRQIHETGFRGPSMANEISLQGDHIEGRVFRQKMPLREQDENNQTSMAFPLASGRNDPQGLITIYNYSPASRDWELQLTSYVNRGARALFESELRQRQKLQIQNQDLQIQRKADLLYLLYRASTLIQTIPDLEKALRLVLTTVTAHFGLRFNRAWIFMVNENKPLLEGACAIGELNEKDAYRIWGKVSNRTADEFIESLLHSNTENPSQIDQIVKSLSLPIASRQEDPFLYVLNHHLTIRWSSASTNYGQLPADFQRPFQVEDAWITPLLADRDCLGLLIVDNKFNNMPIDLADKDAELLSTFANLAAMAIAQDRRRKAEYSRLAISETFREISRILGSTLDIDQVLDSVLEQMDRVLPYNTASVQWLDDNRKNLQIIRARGFPDDREVEKLHFALDQDFPNVKVFHKKEVVRYDDIQLVYGHFSNPSYYVEKVRSWLGVPLLVENEVRGVITVDNFETGVYNAAHETIAVMLAGQAALAIQNARAYKEQFTQKEYLDDLIGSSLDGVVAVDAQGFITNYNERARRICGYSREEVIGQHIKVLYGGLRTPVEIGRLLKSQHTLKDHETTIVDKSGREIPILLSASEITADNGQVIGSVGFFEDQRQKRLARDVNEYLVRLQTQARKLRQVLDALAEQIHSLVGADSVVIYPYNALTQSYDVENIGRFGLLHKAKPFSPKIRTEWSQTQRLFHQGRGSRLVVEDVSTGKDRDGAELVWADTDGFWERERIGAFTALGLWLEKEPVGALFVNYRAPHTWDVEELDTLETFAAYASAIIQQARMIERQQKEHRTVEALQHFVRLSSKGRTDMAWEAILKYGFSVTRAQKGRILAWDPMTETFITKNQKGFKVSEDECFEDHDNARCSFLQGIVAKREPHLVLDTLSEPLPECCQASCRGIRSLLVLPIVGLKNGPRGILVLASDQPAAFDEHDREMMKSIVASVGVTIENITNYQAIEDNNKLLEGLLRAFQDVTTQQDLQTVLEKIADGTRRAMDCDIVTLYAYDEAKGQFMPGPTVTGELFFPDALHALGYVSPESVVWKVLEESTVLHTDDTVGDPLLNDPRAVRVGDIESFVVREKVRSSAGVPMKIHNQNVGVLFVNYRSPHHFDNSEVNALQIFANEAAVAINDTKLYGQLQKRSAHLEAVYEASKIVTASMNRKEILDSILEQVVEKVVPVHEKKTVAGALQIYDPEYRELVMESVYPASQYETVVGKVNKRLSLVRRPGQRYGITARAASERKAQNVGDVTKDRDYIAYSEATRSELAFPLVDGDKLLGVLDIECEQENAFDDTDIDAIEALAELSIVALRNAEAAQEMVRISSIASMGAWGAELAHQMKSDLANIQLLTATIDSDLGDLSIDESLRQELKEVIQEIDQSADKLKLPPMPRSSQEAEQFIPDIPACPDEVIRRICRESRARNPEIHFGEELECGPVLARIHELWFERILQHLLHNAIRAVGVRSDPVIVIKTRQVGNDIRVDVVDNGHGITPGVYPLLFREPTPASPERSGQGLMIVRYLLELHGGHVQVGWNKPGQGAGFYFTVPILSPANGSETEEHP